jgi:hypothetical protein
MYYPAIGMQANNATGRVTSSSLVAYLDSVKVLFQAINAAADAYQAGLSIHVLGWSAKTGQSLSAKVLTIRGDERFDSIERRENDQPAVWSSRTI